MLVQQVAFAQKATVLEVLKKYHVDTAFLDSNAQQNATRYSFDVKTTLVTDDKKKVSISKYDASQPEGQRWKLISVDGGMPGKTDLNTFRKQHSLNIPTPQADDNTYKIVKDEGGQLVITYSYDPNSLVDDNKFLADCPVTLYINTETSRLERSEMISTKPFKIKLIKADYMNTNFTYSYQEQFKEYLPLKEEVTLNLKLLGRLIETTTINEYSSYTRP